MSDCIFCDIVAGSSQASFVYRDAAAVAFMDIATLNPGQVVVIPRVHAPYLKDLDEAGSPRTCPHGRPLFKRIERREIERWIGRRP